MIPSQAPTRRAALLRPAPLMAALMALLFAWAAPAVAHKDHRPREAETATVLGNAVVPGAAAVSAVVMTGEMPPGSHDSGMMDDMAMDRSKLSFVERLVGWLGRLHPLVVHFPIAFFPAALITAIAGRRRPSFAAPVQFLVVAGAIFAPLAAGAGWLAGMSADPQSILFYHRWLGVAIGLSGAALGLWAWRRPWEDRGAGMIFALTVMAIAIAIQGFLGAGITHGMEHMMF